MQTRVQDHIVGQSETTYAAFVSINKDNFASRLNDDRSKRANLSDWPLTSTID